MGNERTAQNSQNRDFLLVDSSNSRPLIGREDHQQRSKGSTLIQKCKFGIVYNPKYAGTTSELASIRGCIIGIVYNAKLWVWVECIIGIGYNAKYAGTTSELASIRDA